MCVRVCFVTFVHLLLSQAALAPESTLLTNVVAKLDDKQRRKCAILLDNMSTHFGAIVGEHRITWQGESN